MKRVCGTFYRYVFLEDPIGAHAFFESIFVLGLILLAFGGNAPAVEGSNFGVVIESNGKGRPVSAFRPENSKGKTPMGDDVAIVFNCGLLVIQKNHCIHVVGIFFLRRSSQIVQPVRHRCAGGQWK